MCCPPPQPSPIESLAIYLHVSPLIGDYDDRSRVGSSDTQPAFFKNGGLYALRASAAANNETSSVWKSLSSTVLPDSSRLIEPIATALHCGSTASGHY